MKSWHIVSNLWIDWTYPFGSVIITKSGNTFMGDAFTVEWINRPASKFGCQYSPEGLWQYFMRKQIRWILAGLKNINYTNSRWQFTLFEAVEFLQKEYCLLYQLASLWLWDEVGIIPGPSGEGDITSKSSFSIVMQNQRVDMRPLNFNINQLSCSHQQKVEIETGQNHNRSQSNQAQRKLP